MSDMIRKQIYITRRQQALLKRQARLRQVSEAAIIRAALDQQSTSELGGRDDRAWQKARQFMLSLQDRAGQSKTFYRWNRMDAYEDRLTKPGEHSIRDNEDV